MIREKQINKGIIGSFIKRTEMTIDISALNGYPVVAPALVNHELTGKTAGKTANNPVHPKGSESFAAFYFPSIYKRKDVLHG